MKLFVVEKGTRGYLLVEGKVMPELKPWTVRKNLTFERADVLLDPVCVDREFPNGSVTLGYDLAKRGYSIFLPGGGDRTKKQKYLLVVPYNQVKVI